MNSTSKIIILIAAFLLLGAGLVFWKSTVISHAQAKANTLTKEEIELLLKDANPMMLKQLADPKAKAQQIDNFKQLLALASQARKDGIADEEGNAQELENIRSSITAAVYDKDLNKDKGPMPAFGFIGEDRVKDFWGDQTEQGGISWLWKGSTSRRRNAEFQEFLDTKINLMKKQNPQMKDREITDEEKEQAKGYFAKIKIYDQEYQDKLNAGQISQELQDKINLQVKLQQDSFLASQYAAKLAETAKVTDADIDKYLSEHPELNPQEKKNKAQDILNRAKSGEDFAKLAKENSDDPGSKDKGGLYEGVTKGKMIPEFEAAALALDDGQIAPELVETPYGYHIIKLEKKTDGKDPQGQAAQTYDVRHILISTGVKDPQNPMGREMPIKDFVRSQLDEQKQKDALDDIVAKNHVEVAEDFTIPPVSDEQMQQIMQQMQRQQGMNGMPPGAGGPPPPPGKGSLKTSPNGGSKPEVPAKPEAPAKGK